MNFFLKLIIISLLLTSGIALPVKQVNETDKYRLPDTIIPTEYAIQFTLNADAFSTNKYTGTISINFHVKDGETVTDIKLHAYKLEIQSIELKINNTTINIEDGPYISDSETSILTITSTTELTGTGYTLNLDFEAVLSATELYGFYISSYIESGVTKYLATTTFEPGHARQAFPCFDEPRFKAVFQITITYPATFNAFNNMVQKETTISDDGELKTTTFQPTPRMSTYLVAVIISEFTCTNGENLGDIPTSVCSRQDTEEGRAWAVSLGSQCLESVQSFVGYNYSQTNIGKMAQVALPDFSHGAMENWGLVTFREAYILWYENDTSNYYKQKAATIICHEFSHQWFGDLVTLEWWSDIFLNEGFATYFEYYGTADVLPDWQLREQFVLDQLQPAFDVDSSESSLPLSSYVSTPLEIMNRFDSISYNKGGCVIRMVHHFMTVENFRKGLNYYINAYQFNNSNPDKLWNALSMYADLSDNLSFVDVMDNWTNKAGYPLLTVELNDNDIIISQERYLTSNGTSDTKWYVPISYTTSNDSDPFTDTTARVWLTPDKDLVIPDALANADWIILNNQQTGYYRINYDDALWDKILAVLTEDVDKVHILNRAQIVDDLTHLAIIKKIPYSRVFELLSFLNDDTNYFPWYSAFNGFSFLLKRIATEKIKTNLTTLILNTMQNLYDSVPFDQENVDDQIYTLKQVMALKWACNLGNTDCVDNSKKIFAEYKNTAARPNRNFRDFVYCTALRNSDTISEDWEFLWNQFNTSTLSTEQVTILSALGCTTDEEILQNYLTAMIDANSGIRLQDAKYAFSSVYSNSLAGVNIASNFLIANFDQINSYFNDAISLNTFISEIIDRFTTQDQIDQFTNFIQSEDIDDDIKNPTEEALESAKANLEWIAYFEDQMSDYFSSAKSESISITVWMISLLIACIQNL